MSKDITIIIKTFERPYCLEALLTSYEKMRQKHDWQCQILIADDSKQPYKKYILNRFEKIVTKYICLPFRSGVSYGRNVLLDNVETPYLVHLDDDFWMDKHCNLRMMKNLLIESDLDLLGGMLHNRSERLLSESRWQILYRLFKEKRKGDLLYEIFEKGRSFFYYGDFEAMGDTLKIVPIQYDVPVTRCDVVLNFFIAKTESIRSRNIYWDNALKTQEHEAFFYEAKLNNLAVGVTKSISVEHRPITTLHYRSFRFEGHNKYGTIFLEKHGFTRLEDHVGNGSFEITSSNINE
ncbi:MAG: glycosyltransferase [Bacteroidota bacterium]